MSSAASIRSARPRLPRPHQSHEETPVVGIARRRAAARSTPGRHTTSGHAQRRDRRPECGLERRPSTRRRPDRAPRWRSPSGIGTNSGRGTGTARHSRRPRGARSARRSAQARAAAPHTAAARSSAGSARAHSATTASACAHQPFRPHRGRQPRARRAAASRRTRAAADGASRGCAPGCYGSEPAVRGHARAPTRVYRADRPGPRRARIARSARDRGGGCGMRHRHRSILAAERARRGGRARDPARPCRVEWRLAKEERR